MIRARWVTVESRVVAKGFDPVEKYSRLLSAVTNKAIRSMWREEMGSPCERGLRRKLDGSGAHYIEVYPPSWIGRIDRTVDDMDRDMAGDVAKWLGVDD